MVSLFPRDVLVVLKSAWGAVTTQNEEEVQEPSGQQPGITQPSKVSATT